ncbi:alpha/beta fold hydrolase [Saccharopolyspora taberi]|uniref:Alpha/beta fold hydrolase n=1 Tax=Saccharopolyspora taberi TaxID=60895 RepID=A0ABN3VLU2_9PSEU
MAFPTSENAEAYAAAYDAVLARWPIEVERLDVPSQFGTTRVHACGPQDATPLVLMHGAGTTSAVWFANAEALSRSHRVYAIDRMGDAGRSVPDGRAITGLPDLMAWLDAVLDHLDLEAVHLCGHSHGAWIALHYALRSIRVRRLALLEPTACFARWKPGYLLRAAPLLRPTPARIRDFVRWETGGGIDPEVLELQALGAFSQRSKVIVRPSPQPERLTVPTLVLVAENSKAHNIRILIRNARRRVPNVETAVVSGVGHHAVPMGNAEETNRKLLRFLVR